MRSRQGGESDARQGCVCTDMAMGKGILCPGRESTSVMAKVNGSGRGTGECLLRKQRARRDCCNQNNPSVFC